MEARKTSYRLMWRVFSRQAENTLLFVLAALAALGAPSPLQAVATGGQPGEFLSFGAGARSLAMGSAFVGVADDASATYWNPAGLSQITRKEITLMKSPLF